MAEAGRCAFCLFTALLMAKGSYSIRHRLTLQNGLMPTGDARGRKLLLAHLNTFSDAFIFFLIPFSHRKLVFICL